MTNKVTIAKKGAVCDTNIDHMHFVSQSAKLGRIQTFFKRHMVQTQEKRVFQPYVPVQMYWSSIKGDFQPPDPLDPLLEKRKGCLIQDV